MSFQPVLPLSGYAGWRFLGRTLKAQTESHAKSTRVASLTAHFRDNIARVQTPDDLLGDRRLLTVALEAFGLGADIDATAFIRKVLADGTTSKEALSSRLADKRYAAFSRAFGFGDLGPRTGLPAFAHEIVTRYERLSFEAAVGEQDDALRRALNADAAIAEVIEGASSDNARWFAMMGNAPLRSVFEAAMGLPSSFASIDLDQQLEQFRDRAERIFGLSRFEDFAAPDAQEKLVRLFLVREQAAQAAAAGPGQIALMLLQG